MFTYLLFNLNYKSVGEAGLLDLFQKRFCVLAVVVNTHLHTVEDILLGRRIGRRLVRHAVAFADTFGDSFTDGLRVLDEPLCYIRIVMEIHLDIDCLCIGADRLRRPDCSCLYLLLGIEKPP